MGKRGPKPQMAKTKALKGNPGNRKADPVQEGVDVTAGSVRMPNGLTAEQKKAWNELLSAFPDWFFTPADAHLMTAYCMCVARIRRAEHLMKNKPLTETRGNGATCRNPLLDIIAGERKALLQMSETLGLTRERRKGAGGGANPNLPETPSEPVGGDPDSFGDLIPDL